MGQKSVQLTYTNVNSHFLWLDRQLWTPATCQCGKPCGSREALRRRAAPQRGSCSCTCSGRDDSSTHTSTGTAGLYRKHTASTHDTLKFQDLSALQIRDLRSFEIRFDFESNFRFGIRFIVMIRFEIFESSAPSLVLCKETIGGG